MAHLFHLSFATMLTSELFPGSRISGLPFVSFRFVSLEQQGLSTYLVSQCATLCYSFLCSAAA